MWQQVDDAHSVRGCTSVGAVIMLCSMLMCLARFAISSLFIVLIVIVIITAIWRWCFWCCHHCCHRIYIYIYMVFEPFAGWMWLIGETVEFVSVCFMYSVTKTLKVLAVTGFALWLGPTVFRGIFCQIPWATSQNSVSHRGKIVQIPRLTAALHSWVNWALSCLEISVIEGWHC